MPIYEYRCRWRNGRKVGGPPPVRPHRFAVCGARGAETPQVDIRFAVGGRTDAGLSQS